MTRDATELGELLRLLGLLDSDRDPNPGRTGLTELEHSLTCATAARDADADTEMQLVALLHDAGKPLSLTRHPQVIAEILTGRMSPDRVEVLRHHGEWQTDVVHGTSRCDAYAEKSWYRDLRRLGDWDAASFDPRSARLPLSTWLDDLGSLYGCGRAS